MSSKYQIPGNKQKPLFIGIFLILLLVTLLYSFMQERNSRYGAPVVRGQDLDRLIQDKVLTATPKDLISFQGQALPFIQADNVFLLPTMKADPKTGVLDAGQYGQLYLCEDSREEEAAETIYVMGEDWYYQTKIIGNPLPVLLFETEEFENRNAYGKMQLFDPSDTEINAYSFKTSDAKLSFTAEEEILSSKERNYSLDLYKEKDGVYEQKKIKLAGMRKDDDWCLDCVFDNLEEAVAFLEKWNEMCLQKNAEKLMMQYRIVDFYLDNQYLGMYILREPKDDKALELKDSIWLQEADPNDTVFGEEIREIFGSTITDESLTPRYSFLQQGEAIYAFPDGLTKAR